MVTRGGAGLDGVGRACDVEESHVRAWLGRSYTVLPGEDYGGSHGQINWRRFLWAWCPFNAVQGSAIAPSSTFSSRSFRLLVHLRFSCAPSHLMPFLFPFVPPNPLPSCVTMANWTRFNLRTMELQALVEGGLLYPLTTAKEWKLPESEERPAPPPGYVVFIRAVPRAWIGCARDQLFPHLALPILGGAPPLQPQWYAANLHLHGAVRGISGR